MVCLNIFCVQDKTWSSHPGGSMVLYSYDVACFEAVLNLGFHIWMFETFFG